MRDVAVAVVGGVISSVITYFLVQFIPRPESTRNPHALDATASTPLSQILLSPAVLVPLAVGVIILVLIFIVLRSRSRRRA